MASDHFEIIIVDNGPHDETRSVALNEFSSVPNLRYVEEPKTGLSVARRTGWQLAVGNIVAYLDDDAIAGKGWLSQLHAAFTSREPQPGCVGGPIEIIWEVPRPAWLSENLETNLTSLDLGGDLRELEPHENVFGANMAFQRSVLHETNAFSEGLGRRGMKLLSNEETLLQRQLGARGYSRIYAPLAIVRHHAPAARLTKAWFRRRAYWQGVSDAKVMCHEQELSHQQRLHVAAGRLRRDVFRPRSAWKATVNSDDPQCFEEQYRIAWGFGFARGVL